MRFWFCGVLLPLPAPAPAAGQWDLERARQSEFRVAMDKNCAAFANGGTPGRARTLKQQP